MTQRFHRHFFSSTLVVALSLPNLAYASSGGVGLLIAFAGVFIVFPLLAVVCGAILKRAGLGFVSGNKPTWSQTLKVGSGEFIVGFLFILAWWNLGIMGLVCLIAYLLATFFLNLRLTTNKFAAMILSLIPPCFTLLLLIFGPFGDHTPYQRLSQIVRKLF